MCLAFNVQDLVHWFYDSVYQCVYFSACMLQQDVPNYEKIIEHCDNALELSQGNVKALYRKGVASYHLRKYDDALNFLQQSRQNGL